MRNQIKNTLIVIGISLLISITYITAMLEMSKLISLH